MATLWRTISKSSSDHVTTTSVSSNNSHSKNQRANLWRSISKSRDHNHNHNHNRSQRLRKCTSLKVATSFTRVCLCAPISSYNEVLRADIPPRRSYSYPRSSSASRPNSLTSSPQQLQDHQLIRAHSARHSIHEVRRVFRGKSLTDDVLMRRFVVEEEAMMQVKRRNQMEVIRKRNSMRRKKLGPSPLCRMVMAQDQYQHQEEKDQHQYY